MDRETDSIHHHYNKCFANISYLLARSKSEVLSVDKDIISACLDVLARLRVWGDESKAELPAVTRGSLDDVLKNESRMRGVVLRNLFRVQKNIAKCELELQNPFSPLTMSRCRRCSRHKRRGRRLRYKHR
jgi:hypothetical protein